MVAVEVVQGATGASGVGSDVGLLEGLLFCFEGEVERGEERREEREVREKEKKRSPTFFCSRRAFR